MNEVCREPVGDAPALLTPLRLQDVSLRNPNWPAPAAVELTGVQAYESRWRSRWGWWLVRRAASLETYRKSCNLDTRASSPWIPSSAASWSK